MITKNEFNEYLASKTKSLLTNDDIYEICIKFKQLPKVEKNWSELAKMIGWKGSGESLRCLTKSKQRRDGTLPKNERELNSRTIEDITNDELLEKKQLLMIQQQKTRDEWSAYRRVIREDSRLQSFKEEISSAIKELNKLPKPLKEYSIKEQKSDVEAVMLLSDLHIGVDCKNFYNVYNSDIARKRLNKYVQDTKKYCKLNNVHRLTILGMGDFIHGAIHTSARIEQEMDITRQIIMASEMIAEALNELSEVAPEVIYRSCTDNHSRAIADKSQSIEEENFNKIIDWYLEERLKNTKVKFMFDNIDISVGKFELLNGKKMMFAHGHLDSAQQAFNHFIGATREFIDYIAIGHYHCESLKSIQNVKVFTNGSIVGTEQYALSKRLFSEPSQTLLIFDGDNVLNLSINLNINE